MDPNRIKKISKTKQAEVPVHAVEELLRPLVEQVKAIVAAYKQANTPLVDDMASFKRAFPEPGSFDAGWNRAIDQCIRLAKERGL